MAEKVGFVIIGAGVVGAAVAYALRDMADDLYILEAGTQPGSGISSRNSGVVHAGLYYPANSLKEQLCRRGARQLYKFAQTHGVPFQKTGKYIVANGSAQRDHLAWLKAKNEDAVPLHWVESIPAGIQAENALFSPNSGIVDQHELIQTLLDASAANLICNQNVELLQPENDGVRLQVSGDVINATYVVNCAGLASANLAKRRYALAKGNYFRVHLPKLLNLPHLVYPAVGKDSPALGIHLTQNLAGEAYLGPDLEWIDTEHYGVSESRAQSFYEAARTYLPWLKPEDLSAGYSGIRPKLDRHRFSDFELYQESPNLVHCLGIESPGLTAAMALGETVRECLALAPLGGRDTHV